MLGLDPLVNYAAKARFKTGGQITAPLVVKTTAGAKGQGVAHSQCIEAWLMARARPEGRRALDARRTPTA